MVLYLVKLLISAATIAIVSELGKRVSWLAALVASLPLTSLLALVWLYVETKSAEKVIDLSKGIFWAVLPSLTFFVAFPILMKWSDSFWLEYSSFSYCDVRRVFDICDSLKNNSESMFKLVIISIHQ
jgi:hypothetical protein